MLSEAIEEEGAPSYIRSDIGSVPRSEATTCEAIYRSSSTAVVARKKHQGDIYRSGQSLATERSDTSTSHSENNKRLHRVVSQPLTRCTEERSDDIAKRSCLNREVLLSVAEAQVLIEQWRQTYNNEHPHSRLGFKSPQEFVRFLSDLGLVRATPSLRQDLSYTSTQKPLPPGNVLTYNLVRITRSDQHCVDQNRALQTTERED